MAGTETVSLLPAEAWEQFHLSLHTGGTRSLTPAAFPLLYFAILDKAISWALLGPAIFKASFFLSFSSVTLQAPHQCLLRLSAFLLAAVSISLLSSPCPWGRSPFSWGFLGPPAPAVY